MEGLLLGLVKQGVFAVVAALAFWFAWRKDKQVAALYDRLEKKSEKYVEKYSELAKELNDTTTALAKALDIEVD